MAREDAGNQANEDCNADAAACRVGALVLKVTLTFWPAFLVAVEIEFSDIMLQGCFWRVD